MTLFAEQWNFEHIGMALMAVAAFGLVGIALLMLGFKLFEWVTPKLNVEEELAKGNIAVGIVVAAAILGISAIVFRAIG
jgi:putative membrane protein